MNIEDIATKDDIKKIEDLIAKLPSTPIVQDFEKTGLTTQQVVRAFGGEVSDGFVANLRKEKIISGKKIGGMWIYNYRSVMDCIPDYLSIKKTESESTK